MPETLLEDLKDQFARGQAVVIVGAGVSIGATGNHQCASWTGLIRHGVQRCREVLGLDEKWAQRAIDDIDSGDLDDLLSAAEKVSAKLGAPKGGEYRRWLRESAGSLKIQNRDTLEALADLDAVLATTNYDGLLEEVTKRPPVTWMDGALVERVLRGDEPGILHLHGYWKDPESVILGIRSYERVLGDAHAQTMLRAMQALRTCVFVGCGKGLEDPNFGALLEWTGKVFAGSEYRRFRLALESERAALQKEHPPEQRLFVISYGKKHEDLAGFLRSLHPAAAAPKAPEAVAAAPAYALPPRPRCFGRDSLIAEVAAALCSSATEPVPVLGPAGIGKSTLALAALHQPEVEKRYGSRRYFVRCDGVTSRAGVAANIAVALDLPLSPEIERAVISVLAQAPAALVIDNAETPWEADTLAVEELLAVLAGVPGLALVTALRGHQRPLGVNWREAVLPPALDPGAARQVFLAIAGRKFDTDARLDDLLSAVDRVPLAITLLAYLAEGEPDLEGLWKRWQQQRTDLLERPGAKDRLSSLSVSYELSLNGPRMTPPARRLLSVLATLPAGVSHGDLPPVFPGAAEEAASVLRKTGLAYDEAGRLRVLAPLRDYVSRHYPPEPSDMDPSIAFYASLARQHGDQVGRKGGAEAVKRLSPEVANIEVALLAGLEAGATGVLVHAAVVGGTFMKFTGVGSGAALEKAASLALGAEDFRSAARCLSSLGDIALTRSDHATALQRFQEALLLYRQVGVVLGEANCIQSLGDIALRRSDHDTARQRYEEALPLYQQVGDILGRANCYQSLGDIALARSDHDTARQRYQEALPLHRQVGDVLGEAGCVFSLGEIAMARSDHDTARRRFEEAMPLYRQVGDVLGEANCVQGLGRIALERSDHDMARQRFQEALLLHRQAGSALGEAGCLFSLGDIALRRSDHDTAREHCQEALPLYRQAGSALGEANCILILGDIALASPDHDTARQRYQEALDLYARIPDPYSMGMTHRRLARLASEQAERKRHVDQARSLWQSIDRPDLVQQLDREFGP